ncbi:hypothetical protein ES703_55921 [subsurface metagenome]
MNKTQIEWVKNPDGTQGYTWNPITGCLNGCEYCYARKLANTRLKERYLANTNLAPGYVQARGVLREGAIPPNKDPFYPRFWEDRLEGITNRQIPRGIFTCDMSDLFGIGIPEKWTWRILNLITYASQHRFYLLTKQPQNLIKFSPFPDNCWCGVTVTKPEFLIAALDALDRIQCSLRYLSIEPMLGKFDIPDLDILLEGTLDWLILGSQTKPYKPPKIEWVREIVEACDKAGIPVFLKDNLSSLFAKDDCVGFTENKQLFKIIDNFPTRYHLRQEMPK